MQIYIELPVNMARFFYNKYLPQQNSHLIRNKVTEEGAISLKNFQFLTFFHLKTILILFQHSNTTDTMTDACIADTVYDVSVEQGEQNLTKKLHRMQHRVSFPHVIPYTLTNIAVTASNGNQTATSRIPPMRSPEISM